MTGTPSMTPCPALRRKQWRHLLALTLVHAVSDTYGGIIAPVLSPLNDRYPGIAIPTLIFIVSLLGFSSNIFQIPIGHLRATWSSPALIGCGVLLAGLTVFIGVLPPEGPVLPLMCLLAVAAGFGIATVHPEGLRAVHGLDQIPSALSTAVFMVAGFLGFASGALLSSWITQNGGLHSLVWLYAAAPLALLPLFCSGVRLPVEKEQARQAPAEPEEQPSGRGVPGVPFLPLFLMAATLATCSQIQATLLPTYLHREAGYSLAFSGLSFTLFGVGGAVGAITWGALAPRIGHLRVLLLSTLLGAPLTLLYLFLAPQTAWAAALFVVTAFIAYTGFPLCITLARHADTRLRFGQRMGLISGGTWGIAALVLWGLGRVAPHTGMGPLLHLVWLGYLAAALLLAAELRRRRRVGR